MIRLLCVCLYLSVNTYTSVEDEAVGQVSRTAPFVLPCREQLRGAFVEDEVVAEMSSSRNNRSCSSSSNSYSST